MAWQNSAKSIVPFWPPGAAHQHHFNIENGYYVTIYYYKKQL
jgi:hypothetical protein